ncbi:RrF2 family transcriptional regulator [Paenibacillus tarimensis]|uniref:RrF2 family transcriptional regulator n=1 Tax=Paenibacillus tarimensis TaxID=416012 RepID=UPI001F349CED|nr:Rrf2 family transcriptional regulator [Paenibacillus tarimensis]MCF2943667.1 Rrf2 family transcriptional regulator [Paenibacillus tarimensis]
MRTDRCANPSPSQKWFGLSLQALVVLSRQEGISPSCDIARKLQSEATLLRKIMAKLAKENILETREGRDGGYKLKKRAEDLTLAEVYKALQMEEAVCSGMRLAAGDHPFGEKLETAFNEIKDELDRKVLEVLGNYTIADLAAKVD